jgi:hypothetical protein
MRARIEEASVADGKEIWETIGDIVCQDGKLSVEPLDDDPNKRQMLQYSLDIDRKHLQRVHGCGPSPEDFLKSLYKIMGRYGRVTLIEDSPSLSFTGLAFRPCSCGCNDVSPFFVRDA